MKNSKQIIQVSFLFQWSWCKIYHRIILADGKSCQKIFCWMLQTKSEILVSNNVFLQHINIDNFASNIFNLFNCMSCNTFWTHRELNKHRTCTIINTSLYLRCLFNNFKFRRQMFISLMLLSSDDALFCLMLVYLDVALIHEAGNFGWCCALIYHYRIFGCSSCHDARIFWMILSMMRFSLDAAPI